MAELNQAFEIPINCENRQFVLHPYIPYQSLIYQEPLRESNVLTTSQSQSRCFDPKCGSIGSSNAIQTSTSSRNLQNLYWGSIVPKFK